MATLARVVVALALLAADPHAVFSARVVKIVDGDTLHVRSGGGETHKVRLVDIDTPEGDQPYGREALEALKTLISEKEVRVESHGSDDYGRLLARVFVGDLDVNAELVRNGSAWVFRRYSDDAKLIALEHEARDAKRGLWALPANERIPPWQWRHPDAKPGKEAAFHCGTKTYCREMTSCAEARFYLTQCGLTRIDGDQDGVPCSSLCKK